MLAGVEGAERTAFQMLIRSADELGYFDANHLLNGFEAYELVEIYNLTTEHHRIPRRALNLADFAGGDCRKVSGGEVLQVLELGGSLVWYKSKENHWVLVTDASGEWIDSLGDDHARSIKAINLKKPEICVAILPYDKVPS